MSKALSKLFPLAVAAAAVLLSAGCGGGGSDTTGDGAPGSTTLSGNVVKGPVAGATVKGYAVAGGARGAQLASVMTDSGGAFTMSLGNYAGPVMVQISGGSYTDEATGVPMAMGPGDMMTAVVPSIMGGGSATVAVTPLTAMAQTMAQHMTGGMNEANIAAANGAVGNYFMVHDILRTQPVNPLVSGSAAGATQDMMNYGMTLAAMSEYAKGAGMSSSSAFVTAMMNDASDGVLDGKASGTAVPMGSGMAMDGGMMGSGATGTGMMRADAGRAGLSSAMAEFMNSSFNRSGAMAASMNALMQQLRDTTGKLQ